MKELKAYNIKHIYTDSCISSSIVCDFLQKYIRVEYPNDYIMVFIWLHEIFNTQRKQNYLNDSNLNLKKTTTIIIIVIIHTQATL